MYYLESFSDIKRIGTKDAIERLIIPLTISYINFDGL
jgi:hypothetical protein